MKPRPISVTILSWLLIVFEGIALFSGLLPPSQHIAEFTQRPFEFGLVQAVRLLGVISGVFMLCGCNWARWLLVAWVAFHVGLSAFHSTQELIIHCVLFVVVACLLFRPPATAYFRHATSGSGESEKISKESAAQ